MQSSPRVSVVMPTYNRLELLDRALESLAGQTYRDFEVVVVNDAGVPVHEVVDKPRGIHVRLVEHQVNKGRCGALNTALGAARGQLVAFLDDDDIVYPHHLSTLVTALGDREDVAVYSHAIKVVEDESGTVVSREVIGATDFDRQHLQVTNFIVGMAVLVPLRHVRAVGGFDEQLRVLEDYELWMKLSRRVSFEHVPIPTAEYRWRPGKGNQTVREWFRFHAALEHIYRVHPVPPGSGVAEQRRHMIHGSSSRADAYSYELSVVVLCGQEVDEAMATVRSYAATLGATDQVELVLAVPDMAHWAPVVRSLEGDVQAFVVDDQDEAAALAFLASRVSGRRVAHLRAGQALDVPAVQALLARPSGTAYVGCDDRAAQPVGAR